MLQTRVEAISCELSGPKIQHNVSIWRRNDLQSFHADLCWCGTVVYLDLQK